MSYFSKDKLRIAVEEKLNRDLTSKEWEGVCLMLDIEEPFHLEEADLQYDMPRIRRLLTLLKIEPP